VTADELRERCLALPGAVEDYPFGPETATFRVEGKMFAITMLRREPLEVSLKCEPEMGERLRDSYPAIRGGYHLNKRHWVTVTLDGSVPDPMVADLVEDSYDLVVAGLTRAARSRLLRLGDS